MEMETARRSRPLLKGHRRGARVFVVSSPSGGGKTTVVSALLKRAKGLARSVSYTTRPPRPTERPGTDYRFVSARTFERMRSAGELLEWAQVHGACYGTPARPVLQAVGRGRDVVLSIDVQGARRIRRRFGSQAVLIFLAPPSIEDLRARLIKRQTETPESIRRRLDAAQQELACVGWYDYVVVNRRVNEAARDLEAIVTAERLRADKEARHEASVD